MKEIKAYIQPFMLQKVITALRRINIQGMSITEIKGAGKEKDESYPHYSMDYIVDLTPKVKLEIICSDSDAKKVINVIKESAQTGRGGDGKIIISNIEEVISIRTGKAGDEAI
jgi:nitrogen regulatory protein P-II 1